MHLKFVTNDFEIDWMQAFSCFYIHRKDLYGWLSWFNSHMRYFRSTDSKETITVEFDLKLLFKQEKSYHKYVTFSPIRLVQIKKFLLNVLKESVFPCFIYYIISMTLTAVSLSKDTILRSSSFILYISKYFSLEILYLLKFFHRHIDGRGEGKDFLLRLQLRVYYGPYTLANFLLWRTYCINFKQIANESFSDFTWQFMGLKCKCLVCAAHGGISMLHALWSMCTWSIWSCGIFVMRKFCFFMRVQHPGGEVVSAVGGVKFYCPTALALGCDCDGSGWVWFRMGQVSLPGVARALSQVTMASFMNKQQNVVNISNLFVQYTNTHKQMATCVCGGSSTHVCVLSLSQCVGVCVLLN